MASNLYKVSQNTLLAESEGASPSLPLTRMGLPVELAVWDYLSLMGRMFNLQETTTGTPITAQAVDAGGIVLTAPAIRVGVPTGTTVFPYRLQVAIETAAGTLNEIAVIASETSSYTSGGTAVTPVNWRTDNPRASAAVNVYHCSGSAIVEAALTRPRALFKYVRAAAFTAGETFDGWTNYQWPHLRPIVGPASLLVYIGAAGTASTYLFSLDWAEVPTTSVV